MRKIQKAQILDCIQTLGEANEELKKHTSSDVLINLAVDTQNFLIGVVEYIETLNSSQGIKIAELLCVYFETMNNIQPESDAKDIVSILDEQFKIIKTTAENIEANRIEVAFFPYNLSMWDSLESIYLAAKQDPNCDAYCVPIPWFEWTSERTVAKIHYDGREYPKNIEVIDWEKYDVEARRPDVIYIHNPYDDGNIISSVHPNYYSKVLRKHTDCLVYVPYFVIGEKEVAHFAVTYGCACAHKVIVENEVVRDKYIKAFKDAFGNRYGKPEEKFVALGSPKYDKVNEDYDLPEDWKQIIYNADGSKKKVVLFNTSIGAALENTEKYLQKLKVVINTFKNQEDCVLLWRPHPLLGETFRTMRPNFLEEYEKIVEDYKLNCKL